FPSRPGVKPPIDAALVEIQDPQAGYLYVLDSIHRVTYRVPVRPRVDRDTWTVSLSGANTEILGTKFVSGITFTGRRTTSANGNVDEAWIDLRTGVAVERALTSPMAVITMNVENYSNAEPDPALFVVPADYQVVDASGSITIEVSRAGN